MSLVILLSSFLPSSRLFDTVLCLFTCPKHPSCFVLTQISTQCSHTYEQRMPLLCQNREPLLHLPLEQHWLPGQTASCRTEFCHCQQDLWSNINNIHDNTWIIQTTLCAFKSAEHLSDLLPFTASDLLDFQNTCDVWIDIKYGKLTERREVTEILVHFSQWFPLQWKF